MLFPPILAAFLAVSAQDGVPDLGTCRRGSASPWGNVGDVRQAYGLRSVAIVNAALTRDLPALQAMVGANARFSVARGDAGYGPRTGGPAAAIEFFTELAPTDYRFSVGFAGPVSVGLCGGGTIELLVTGRDRAALLQFRFEGTMLAGVTGTEVFVMQGQFRRPHVD